MPVYLLNADGDAATLVEVERMVKPAIPDLRRVATVEDIGAPLLKGSARSIAIVAAPSEENELSGLIDVVGKRQKDVFFIVVGGDLSARRYKQLIQSGNAEWVAESASAEEILGVVARAGAAAPAAGTKQPVVLSFLPSAGGVGNSTLAIETAIQLIKRRAAKDGKIALVDLDFQCSHVCDYLDVAPKFRIEEIIEEPERLDDRLLEIFAARHSSGLEILAGPRNRLHFHDIGVEALSALFERMAHHYGYIVVDLPVSAHPWTIPLLIASEGILVTGVNTIPGLRQIAETIRALRAESGINADVRTVVNRCELGLFGRVVRGDHVARVLGEEERFYVRSTSLAVECANIGEPMTLVRPSEKAVKDIAAIADFCLALKPFAQRQV